MKIVFYFVLCMCFWTDSNAQFVHSNIPPTDIVHLRIGVTGGLSVNQNVANFKGLPNVPSCCPSYGSGSGVGLMAGLMASLPISEKFELGLRFGYQNIGGSLLATEKETVDNGQMVSGLFEHSITTTIGVLSLEPVVEYQLMTGLMLRGGIQAGIPMEGTFTQQERIIEPQTIVYRENGQKNRLNYSGDLPDASKLMAALTLGVSYALPMNRNESLHLVPEVSYAFGLTNLMTSRDWKVNGIRLGVGLRYSMIDLVAPTLPEPEKIDLPSPTMITDIPKAKKFKFEGEVRRALRDSTGASISIPLEVKNLVSTNMYALMNYIFFDSSSSEFAARYKLISQADAQNFTPKILDGNTTLQIYYNILNILGWRMKVELPTSTIKVIGCNSNLGGELANRVLSRARAEKVMQYLIDVWGINENRISIQARNLPEVPSNSSKEDGVAENRRVEIIPDQIEMLEPLVFSDTTQSMAAKSVGISTTLISDEGVHSWKAETSQSGKILGTISGNGNLPQIVDCPFAEFPVGIPKTTVPLDVKLTVTDNVLETISQTAEPIAVLQTFQQKMRIEKFNLIVFGFNVSAISPMNNLILGLIKKQIKPTSRVNITGHTDRMGNSDYNQRLSKRRATEIARVLKVNESNASGAGGEMSLFDNDLPEGRFYSRTVRIVVETPLE
ncbi:MAG: OmpA family protein [Ignavibacteria bacterium]|nr:OmpA family protein [Ignavibacteria bacterium]